MAMPVQQEERIQMEELDSNSLVKATARLYEACRKGLRRNVEPLLQQGANPNQMNEALMTYPIHAASENLDFDVLKLLLDNKADVNATEGQNGNTALHIVISKAPRDGDEQKYNKVLDLLLSVRSLNVGIKNKEGCTPRGLAIKKNLPELVNRLNVGFNSLVKKMQENDEKTFTKLLKEATPEDKTACLYEACREGRSPFVKKLLEHGANPNQENEASMLYPIHVASENLYFDVLKLLLDKHADVNATEGQNGNTALHIVISKAPRDGDEQKFNKVIDLLLSVRSLKVGIENKEGNTPRGLAVKKNLPELVNRLNVAFNSLVKAMGKVDEETFTKLLKQATPEDKTACLYEACRGKRRHFVELLLQHGANPNQMNEASMLYPIHAASENLDFDVLKLLLDNKADVNVKEGELGYTALHIVISKAPRDGDEEKLKNFLDRLDPLLSVANLNVDIENNEGYTPLELAVENNLRELVDRLIVKFHATINVRAKEAMQNKMPDMIDKHKDKIVEFTGNWDKDTFKGELWYAFINKKYDESHEMLNQLKNGTMGLNDVGLNLPPLGKSSLRTLLQLACQYQWEDIVKLLLDAECDPNKSSPADANPPLLIAANLGNRAILELLTGCSKTELDCVGTGEQTALHKIAQQLSNDKQKYSDCLKIILEKVGTKPLDVNAKDSVGNTALHYAAYSGVEEAVLQLLRKDANISIKNNVGSLPLKWIRPSTLEQFLDERMEFADKDKGMDSPDFQITFQHSFFMPVEPKGGINPECDTLWHLSQSKRHKRLLLHPVFASFLMLKWHQLKWFFFANLALHVLTAWVLTGFLLTMYSEDVSYKTWIDALWIVLVICVVILSLRELFQLFVAPIRYFCTLENYIKIGMRVLVCVVLSNSGDPKKCQPFSAIAVLFATLELLLLIGRLPCFSTFVNMFTTVSKTFLRLLTLFSMLIVGFSLSFFCVFRQSSTNGADLAETDTHDSGNRTHMFRNFESSLLKTIIMMTGEMELSNLQYDKIEPIVNRVIFVLILVSFVFLITIVLMSLLTGLAVGDIQAIRSKAKIVSCANFIDFVAYLEALLLGDPYDFMAKWPKWSWLRQRNFVRRSVDVIKRKWPREYFKGIVLVYNTEQKEFILYPNQPGQKKKFISEEDIRSACYRIREKKTSKQPTDLPQLIRQLQLAVETISRRDDPRN